MSGSASRPTLLVRRPECHALDQLLTTIRAGRSSALVLRGEAGIGKTALLEYAAASATRCRVARVAGVESEMELAFAGLHQLCSPFLGRLDRLAGPQRDALGVAFGLRDGSPPDRFLIGVAALSLLCDVADDQPLVCLIDDAQWLDQASAHTLAFVARRLVAESVAFVFATRDTGEDPALRGLPDLLLPGLDNADARVLLGSALRSSLDAAVLDGLVAEARGNPLALQELPRGRTPAQLAFGFGVARSDPLDSQMEQGFVRQLEPLPADTRKLLLVAAVEPVGDVTVVWRAVGRLGVGSRAAAPAEAAGLIEFGTRVRFRHPLIRSAAWRTATVRELREAHAALAEANDLDLDRRAWHRAQASTGPDEDVASELAQSADRAHARGGVTSAAAFLERAAELTPDAATRADRLLAAARARLQAGEFDAASELLVSAEAAPPDAAASARIELLRAHVVFGSHRSSAAPPLLLAAARRLEPLDLDLARDTYLDALSAAMFAGRFAGAANIVEVAKAVPRAAASEKHHRDVLLEGLSALFTDGYSAAMPLARRALGLYRAEDPAGPDGLRWLWLASSIAADVWDDGSWQALSARHMYLARDAGALSELLLALNSRIVVLLFAGELAEAGNLVDEASVVRDATESSVAPYGAMALAAWRGREEEARRLLDASSREAVARGEGIGVTVARWTDALLYNGLGRYADALVEAREAATDPNELGAANWGLVELVEAAAGSGATGEAAEALAKLCAMTRAGRTDWAVGVEARSRALLTTGDTAEQLYREAIQRLGRSRCRAELARACLLYGKWLRREGRPREARAQLRSAVELFSRMGAEGFGERARHELFATGERARPRASELRDRLTPQEAQIARLAADRRTNTEIGAQLFISPRTVEWHLRKVFTVYGISSRKDLPAAMAGDGPAGRS